MSETLYEIINLNLDEFATELFTTDIHDELWPKPTEEISVNFTQWRTRTFNKEYRWIDGNPNENPEFQIRDIKKEIARLTEKITSLYSRQDELIEIGNVAESYYTLAQILGLLDYLNLVLKQEKHTETLLTIVSSIENKLADPLQFKIAVSKLSNAAIALLYYYIGLKITKTNCHTIKNGDNSGSKLPGFYKLFNDNVSERINKTMQSSNKINEHLSRYKEILPVLETYSPEGYRKAKLELDILKGNYFEHYSKIFTTP